MKARFISACVALVLCGQTTVLGYPVEFPEGLAKMTERADLICKARVVSTDIVTNASLRRVSGFVVESTTLELITVLKGDAQLKRGVFQHYATAPPSSGILAIHYHPQFYELKIGQTYLIFAVKTERAGEFRQVRESHTMKEDEGVLRTLDARPVAGLTVPSTHWQELNLLLTNGVPADALYAIHQLDLMSRTSDHEDQSLWRSGDFSRQEVLKVLSPLMFHANEEVAVRAMRCFRLLPHGKDEIQSHAGVLIRLADSSPTATRRINALGALFGSKLASVSNAIPRWLADPNALVRAQAVTLLAGFPGASSEAALRTAANDAGENVRAASAWVIGQNQIAGLIPTLGQLLADKTGAKPQLTTEEEEQVITRGYREDRNGPVRSAAVYALLRFERMQVDRVLRSSLSDDYFKPAIVAKLAVSEPEAWLPHFAEILERKLVPMNFRTGANAYWECWHLLHGHLKSLPAESFKDGKLDRYLLALENAGTSGSHEPEQIYKLYRAKGLADRAAKYRKHCTATLTYDIGYYFDRP